MGGEPAAARTLIAALRAAGLLAGAVLTADAAHTQAVTAAALTAGGGHYLLTVKGNQPTLARRCKKLPWGQLSLGDKTTSNDQNLWIGGWVRTLPVISEPNEKKIGAATLVGKARTDVHGSWCER